MISQQGLPEAAKRQCHMVLVANLSIPVDFIVCNAVNPPLVDNSLLTPVTITASEHIEDGTDTYAEENYSHILNEGNMVQPRKPVFPFTCDECHSSAITS